MGFTKEQILAEIHRTTARNGSPLGEFRFSKATGIQGTDWCGRYWLRWNDALLEAGYPHKGPTSVRLIDVGSIGSLMKLLHEPTDEGQGDDPSWDRWWKQQLREDGARELFPILPAQPNLYLGKEYDVVNRDDLLVNTMLEYGLRTVLCAGNGISQEPRALAEAGFDVTALDASPSGAPYKSCLKKSEQQLWTHLRNASAGSGSCSAFASTTLLTPLLDGSNITVACFTHPSHGVVTAAGRSGTVFPSPPCRDRSLGW